MDISGKIEDLAKQMAMLQTHITQIAVPAIPAGGGAVYTAKQTQLPAAREAQRRHTGPTAALWTETTISPAIAGFEQRAAQIAAQSATHTASAATTDLSLCHTREVVGCNLLLQPAPT